MGPMKGRTTCGRQGKGVGAGPRTGHRMLPSSAMPAAGLIVRARALRGFAGGLVSVLLAVHRSRLGPGPLQVGAIATGTLLGSAALTLAVGLGWSRARPPTILLWHFPSLAHGDPRTARPTPLGTLA